MERVTYQEHGVTKLENFNMTIWQGEIMGLVPVNHHGLSSLVGLLRQNLPLHYGFVYYREKLVNHWQLSGSGSNRISIIQNRSSLAEGLTIADNVFVLRPGFKKHVMNPRVFGEQLMPYFNDIEMNLSPEDYIENLSSFERIVVELLKAVVTGNKLVVLDDVGTFLSEEELKKLHKILCHYAGQGISFLYIAAHFEETRQICDRIGLMINGQIIKCFHRTDTPPDTFYFQCTADFDRHVREQLEARIRGTEHKNPVFGCEGLCCGEIRHLDFEAYPGECLVIQEVDGQIFKDLIGVLTGERRPESGIMRVGEARFKGGKGREVAVIQELPTRSMLFPNLSYLDNLCFTLDHRFRGVWSTDRIKRSLRREYEGRLGGDVFDLPVEDLTEEQQYDLIYTRILIQNPKVVFCVQPFKGAEVSLRLHIWSLLKMLMDKGIAVVILAVNLADSLALADRLVRIQSHQKPQEYDREDFGRLPVNTPWLHLYQERE